MGVRVLVRHIAWYSSPYPWSRSVSWWLAED